ncbi:MAG: universal stress protein [Deltaproteobacteria bacterium]|nr:universal stress protein [Deltaproteobacteria bacterium]
MGKTLVVGVDGSEHAKKAARYAAELAVKLDASLLLVHAVPSLAMPAGAIGFGEELLQANRVRGEAILDLLVNELEKPTLKVQKRLIDDGSPPEVLANVAKEVGAEMVVVGSTGANAVSRMFLGSVANRLGHVSPVPVLIVR